MAVSTLTGTRIRERRIGSGRKQSALAAAVGISPSYLNLIEHNKRSIGGKLLADIARTLDVEVTSLSEGADMELVSGLEAAIAAAPIEEGVLPELDRIEEFCNRFPGWASALDSGYRRIERLERKVAAMTDRLAHDPFLSAALHEVLSRVTAIRSTASILTGAEEVDATWQKRFQENLHEEAQKLSGDAEALVRYFDDAAQSEPSLTQPAEEFDAFVDAHGYHFTALEGEGADIDALLAGEAVPPSEAGAVLLRDYLETYAEDAKALPLARFAEAAQGWKFDPFALAGEFNCDPGRIIRRLSTLPEDTVGDVIGRVACDQSGALTFRKAPARFVLPRVGPACTIWPIYEALRMPGTPVVRVLTQRKNPPTRVVAIAIASCLPPRTIHSAPRVAAEMALLPASLVPELAQMQPPDDGVICPVCNKSDCLSRR